MTFLTDAAKYGAEIGHSDKGLASYALIFAAAASKGEIDPSDAHSVLASFRDTRSLVAKGCRASEISVGVQVSKIKQVIRFGSLFKDAGVAFLKRLLVEAFFPTEGEACIRRAG